MLVMAFIFIAVLLIGVPVFIALAGSSLLYTHFIAGIPDFVILHRMAGGIDSFPLLALVDFIKLGFLGLLAFFSLTITERMHLQRMTVFDLPMSYVYGGVAFGCIFMFLRQAINVWRNARIGWSRPDDVTHQIAAD